MTDEDTLPITEPDLAGDLTYREKALRDLFVNEYLTDYDSLQAAIRIGYARSYAREYAVRFMEEPYVLQQIKLRESNNSVEQSPEEMKKRVMIGLIREANYRGPGCSQAARVAALGKLAEIHGMNAPTRTQSEITGANGQPLNGAGVFVIPGIMTEEQWAEQAAAQQAALVASPPPSSNIH